MEWTIGASQLHALYDQIQQQNQNQKQQQQKHKESSTAVAIDTKGDADVTADTAAISDNDSDVATGASKALGVLLHELVIGGDGMAFQLNFQLGGDDQRPHMQQLLKAVAASASDSKSESEEHERLLQALLELVPDAPIRVSAHLAPCSYAMKTVLPQDAKALAMRSAHDARLGCVLSLEGSGLQSAMMLMRPGSLKSWSLRDTAISAFDVEVQADTAEGKAEPSVRLHMCVRVLACSFVMACHDWA